MSGFGIVSTDAAAITIKYGTLLEFKYELFAETAKVLAERHLYEIANNCKAQHFSTSSSRWRKRRCHWSLDLPMMAKYVTKSSCYFNGQTNATKRARSCMGLEGAMKSAYSVQRKWEATWLALHKYCCIGFETWKEWVHVLVKRKNNKKETLWLYNQEEMICLHSFATKLLISCKYTYS